MSERRLSAFCRVCKSSWLISRFILGRARMPYAGEALTGSTLGGGFVVTRGRDMV